MWRAAGKFNTPPQGRQIITIADELGVKHVGGACIQVVCLVHVRRVTIVRHAGSVSGGGSVCHAAWIPRRRGTDRPASAHVDRIRRRDEAIRAPQCLRWTGILVCARCSTNNFSAVQVPVVVRCYVQCHVANDQLGSILFSNELSATNGPLLVSENRVGVGIAAGGVPLLSDSRAVTDKKSSVSPFSTINFANTHIPSSILHPHGHAQRTD